MNHNNHFCLWYTDELDGFEVEDNRLIWFKQENNMKKFCYEKNISFSDEVISFDIEQLSAMIKYKPEEFDCKLILDMWNIFSDVSKSVNQHFIGDDDMAYNIYSKIFYGNNLPAINTSGKKYIPLWNKEELETIYEILYQGISILESALA
jgi:hypothetical protein